MNIKKILRVNLSSKFKKEINVNTNAVDKKFTIKLPDKNTETESKTAALKYDKIIKDQLFFFSLNSEK